MTAWLSNHLTAVGGFLAALIGVGDLETTQRAGAEWDKALILAGLSLVVGYAVPTARAALQARR